MKYVFFTLCAVGLVFYVCTHYFRITKIEVVGSGMYVSIDQKKFPRYLLFFPQTTIRNEILSANAALSDVQFEKRYPSTLVIKPILRATIAYLSTPSRTVLLDEHGIAVADTAYKDDGRVRITVPPISLKLGEQVADTSVQTSVAFYLSTKSLISISSLIINEDGVIRAHGENLDIVITRKSTVSDVVATLQTLLTGFRIKGTLPKVIDLRFDKPVVTF